MLDSLPLPLQALLWPLAGAAVILIAGRLLPNGLRRLVAMAAALASLSALWSLRTGAGQAVEVFWAPLGFFRSSPTLEPHNLSLLVGITLSGAVAVSVLGIRGSFPRHAVWHGLILVVLAGCLLMSMAANLPTLAIGSALVDLGLIAIAILAPGDADRTMWRMAIPGVSSTLLIFLGALQMSIQVGTTSLQARDPPGEILLLIGLAAMLRLTIFPLHPRGLNTPESAITQILSIGAGVYLLVRPQAIAPILSDRPWILALGSAALLAGGLQAWTGNRWSGFSNYQKGFVLISAILLAGAMPWAFVGLVLALAALGIWWDSSLEREPSPRPRWMETIVESLGGWWVQARARVRMSIPALGRWRGRPWRQQIPALLPTIALASLAGFPLTVGALGRWPVYAILLERGDAAVMLAMLIADTFLAAGLWAALRLALKQSTEHRLTPVASRSMVVLGISLVLLGIAPSSLTGALDLDTVSVPEVSVWGLGLVYVLPWLLGSWLARTGPRLERYFEYVKQIVSLNWLYRMADWIGQRLAGAIYWVGRVGEGEGWWGWALIILALGAMFLTTR
jgi:NADH:ubiquinone oxidoreductase subunit 2 (subunit N)